MYRNFQILPSYGSICVRHPSCCFRKESQHRWYTFTSTLNLYSRWPGSGRAGWMLVSAHIDQLWANKEHLEQYHQTQRSDSTCSPVMEYCCRGWPDRNKLTQDLQPYWSGRGGLTIGEDPFLHGICSHVVVPLQMQAEMKQTQSELLYRYVVLCHCGSQ